MTRLRLTRRRRTEAAGLYAHLNPAKLRAIDCCFAELGCETFADLGGVWAVDGGYARYAADAHAARDGVIVDDDFTDTFLAHSARLPRLRHTRGNFGDTALIESLEAFDAAFFFDVLLHQVDPDWDDLLELYAQRCRVIAVVQPQFDGPETIRLLDLGEQDYLATVPADETYAGLFDRLDDLNPRRGRPWRDVHDIWQWGITDEDLVARMDDLGFGIHHREQTGPWGGLGRFHESAFVFSRRGAAA